jgi:hypothetical protein
VWRRRAWRPMPTMLSTSASRGTSGTRSTRCTAVTGARFALQEDIHRDPLKPRSSYRGRPRPTSLASASNVARLLKMLHFKVAPLLHKVFDNKAAVAVLRFVL